MRYEKTIPLSQKDIDGINALLVPPKNKEMVIQNCPQEVLKYKFKNNFTIAIFVDVPEYSPDGDNQPWLYAELFDPEGVSIRQSNNSDTILGEWEITEDDYDSNDIYNIIITQKK